MKENNEYIREIPIPRYVKMISLLSLAQGELDFPITDRSISSILS